jgi:beta-mannosidase
MDIYKPVIISPFYNETSKLLDVYVTSDLWSTSTGVANFTWYDWSGKPLKSTIPTSVPVTIGAINTTLALRSDLRTLLRTYSLYDIVLHMSVSVEGHLPNNSTVQIFTHENWFYIPSLADAKLVNPGLSIEFDKKEGVFWVEAKKGVAAWVWIEYPEGPVVWFQDNGFWLRKGERRRVGFEVWKGGREWIQKVGVESLWDMTVP